MTRKFMVVHLNELRVVVRGGGDLGTGVARRLFLAGMRVVVLERRFPTAVRWCVALASAVHLREVRVDGVLGKRAEKLPEKPVGWIPILVDEKAEALSAWRPHVLVDARMLKKTPPDTHREQAELVIGLGPGFWAGENCHAVVETMRGHNLGRVIWEGGAHENTGVPAPVNGFASERVVRAPVGGIFYPEADIGDRVRAGEVIARIGHQPLRTSISGVLRGLLYAGTPVRAGQKVADVDPRGKRQNCFTISDKANAVAGGVLEAILTHFGRNI